MIAGLALSIITPPILHALSRPPLLGVGSLSIFSPERGRRHVPHAILSVAVRHYMGFSHS
jgi:hypothetical protein